MFHTSRWDYDYTGGSSSEPMSKLNDKRVAIIGTGATAIQCVPAIAQDAEQLYVVQRTPSAVDVRDNAPTNPDWVKSLSTGWQQQRLFNFDATVTMVSADADMVSDGWTTMSRRALETLAPKGGVAKIAPEEIADLLEEIDFDLMESIRHRVDDVIDDPKTAAALKPWYRRNCKRPCFHDEYLPTFNRQNVSLVDTEGLGVERITETGIVIAGEEIEVDCIILATGFDFIGDYPDRAGYEIIGRQGQELGDKWRDGYRTLHGMQSHGFPNCFILGNKQSTFAWNYSYLAEQQATHIAHIIGETRRRGYSVAEVTAEAEQEWVDFILALPDNSPNLTEQCTPGIYNMEGGFDANRNRQDRPIAIAVQFFSMLAQWREQGDLQGLQLSE
jgi:cyclohexanone monooxygenase